MVYNVSTTSLSLLKNNKITITNTLFSYDGRDGSIGEQLAKNGEGVRTRYCHARGGMGSSLGRPVLLEGVAVGTEILDMTTFEWSQGPTQPFYNSR